MYYTTIYTTVGRYFTNMNTIKGCWTYPQLAVT
jgi:hypothetical protein